MSRGNPQTPFHHTHDAQGQVKPRALQDCACAKYSKHRRGYHANGIGFFPFVVDTLCRLHADARRALWHLASRQIARHYQRRGYPGGAGVRSDFQQDCARRARLLVLECAMQQAVAGVRQRLPPDVSRAVHVRRAPFLRPPGLGSQGSNFVEGSELGGG